MKFVQWFIFHYSAEILTLVNKYKGIGANGAFELKSFIIDTQNGYQFSPRVDTYTVFNTTLALKILALCIHFNYYVFTHFDV